MPALHPPARGSTRAIEYLTIREGAEEMSREGGGGRKAGGQEPWQPLPRPTDQEEQHCAPALGAPDLGAGPLHPQGSIWQTGQF